MSDLLSKLPLEISNQVYEELLVDKIDPIELQSAIRDPQRLKKKLHTSILRVSKLVYAQASTVLYGQNRFRFQYPKRCVKRGGMNLFSLQSRPKNGALDSIKHVDIVFSPRLHNHVCQDAEEIMAVVRYIDNLRCSMKTLRLAFTFKEAPGSGWFLGDDRFCDNDSAFSAARAIASSAVLIDAVSNLQVENKIQIIIESEDEDCLVLFQDFATQIGSEKQWATTFEQSERGSEVDGESAEEEKGSADCGKEAMEDFAYEENDAYSPDCICDSCTSPCSEYDPQMYIWTWTLTPATNSIKCIPKTDPT